VQAPPADAKLVTKKTTKYERELAYQQEMLDAVRARTGKTDVLPNFKGSPTTPIAPATAAAPAFKFDESEVKKTQGNQGANPMVPPPSGPALAATTAAPAAGGSIATAAAAASAPAGKRSALRRPSCGVRTMHYICCKGTTAVPSSFNFTDVVQ
jgi:hypothetical protein